MKGALPIERQVALVVALRPEAKVEAGWGERSQ